MNGNDDRKNFKFSPEVAERFRITAEVFRYTHDELLKEMLDEYLSVLKKKVNKTRVYENGK